MRVSEIVECRSGFRDAKGVLSAPFPKVKRSWGAPDLEEHSLDKQVSPPAIPGVLQEITVLLHNAWFPADNSSELGAELNFLDPILLEF